MICKDLWRAGSLPSLCKLRCACGPEELTVRGGRESGLETRVGERYGPGAKPSVKAAAGWKGEGGVGHGVRRAPSTEEVCGL